MIQRCKLCQKRFDQSLLNERAKIKVTPNASAEWCVCVDCYNTLAENVKQEWERQAKLENENLF